MTNGDVCRLAEEHGDLLVLTLPHCRLSGYVLDVSTDEPTGTEWVVLDTGGSYGILAAPLARAQGIQLLPVRQRT